LAHILRPLALGKDENEKKYKALVSVVHLPTIMMRWKANLPTKTRCWGWEEEISQGQCL